MVINEVESSDPTPGPDWVELYNRGDQTADISGWMFLDNDDTHTHYVFPSGTTIAPGAFLVIDVTAFIFGLGGADSARLFDVDMNLIDSFTWTTAAAVTYGRCPNGTGAFNLTCTATSVECVNTVTSTQGAANACP